MKLKQILLSVLLIALCAPAPAAAAVAYPLAVTNLIPDAALVVQVTLFGSSSPRKVCIANDGVRHDRLFTARITGIAVYPVVGPGCIPGALWRQFTNLAGGLRANDHNLVVSGTSAAPIVTLR
jgi:hypothetical protein